VHRCADGWCMGFVCLMCTPLWRCCAQVRRWMVHGFCMFDVRTALEVLCAGAQMDGAWVLYV